MRLVYLWVSRPVVDIALAFIVAVAFYIYLIGPYPTIRPDETTIVTAFQGLAAIAVTLAGFTITSITLLVGTLRAKLDKLDDRWEKSSSKSIGSVMFKPLRILALTFGFSIAVVFASANPGTFRTSLIAIAIGCGVGSFAALSRNVWIIRKLVDL